MFTTKNRSFNKLIYQLTAMILVVLLLGGCGGNIPSSEDKPDDEGKPELVKPEAEKPEVEKPEAAIQPEEQQGATSEQQQDAGSDTPGSPATASESYGAF